LAKWTSGHPASVAWFVRVGVVVFLLLIGATGCANEASNPTLQAFSDSDGVLHIEGKGWNRCAPVDVKLPQPWGASRKQVDKDGHISLSYGKPLVKPYRGRVTARQRACDSADALDAAAEIRVGDPRG
jgi:hypothetical protein